MVQKNRLVLLLSGASLLAACAAAPQPRPVSAISVEAVETAAPAAVEPAPVSALVEQVSIPHSSFRLANGLTVLVHEDHKAPVVAVNVWYNVGAKDEPRGKTGFAHLFEHLMFNGSENLPGDYFVYLQQIGATDENGTTSFDRTNYFQTVPKSGLERVLFMESDRMGYLLGAVTQEKLDNQRGVVQNEKRQGDNAPGGLVKYELFGGLFPPGHPYDHLPIGSMADLDAASLADVKQWFIDNYGPNNAVLVIAGDITAAEARPLVEKYFGAIKAGPANLPAAADVPTLSAPRSIVMKDRVAATSVSRYWAVPGLLSNQLAALDLGGSVLGGLASSRLDRILVRDEKLAVSVSAGLQGFQRVGLFSVNATVKPGVDPALVERRLDEIVTEFVANGPSEDELRRAATSDVSGRIAGLEQVGGFNGKAQALAEGQTFAADSDYYKKTLARYAATSPADVRAALQQWLRRPALAIRLEPGDRPPYEEAKFKPRKGKSEDFATARTRREIPPLGAAPSLDFPDVQHATLSNGIKLHYAQRTAVPTTQLSLAFDAGFAADAPSGRGLQNLTLSLLDEGADGMTSQEIAEAQERLGARISAAGSADRSNVGLFALSANLGPSLDLLADVVQRPDFAPAEVERVRSQVLTGIAQEQKTPQAMAARTLPALLLGEAHPYATTGSGDPAAVKTFTRDDLSAFHQRWLRPDNVDIFVVSSLPLAEVEAQLEQRFGRWAAPAVSKGAKAFAGLAPRAAGERIVLIDRPGSPQSYILGGQLVPIDPSGDLAPVNVANDVLAGSFLSRVNMDLRETKGWSYGAGGGPQLNQKLVRYTLSAPVQSDRTADSIAAMRKDVREFLTAKGVTEEEVARTLAQRINELPGSFETAASVLQAMQSNALYGRPDNYYELLANRYRTLNREAIDAALRGELDPEGFVWVVVGDAAKVKPQLDKLKLPVALVQPR